MSREGCELRRERWEALKREIARGIEAADRGELIPAEERVIVVPLVVHTAERHLLAEIPAHMEIVAGIVDVKDPRVQTCGCLPPWRRAVDRGCQPTGSCCVHREASAAAPSNWRLPQSQP